jgi:hypothetical protein
MMTMGEDAGMEVSRSRTKVRMRASAGREERRGREDVSWGSEDSDHTVATLTTRVGLDEGDAVLSLSKQALVLQQKSCRSNAASSCQFSIYELPTSKHQL